MFDEVASQPVPDRFLNLLDQLENAGPQPSGDERHAPGQESRAPAFGSSK